MRFIGTSPWIEKGGGGYEFRLTGDDTWVHLHDTDIVKIDYRADVSRLKLFFQYDEHYAEGLLQRRPIVTLSFHECTILEWENEFESGYTGPSDLSVKSLNLYDGNT